MDSSLASEWEAKFSCKRLLVSAAGTRLVILHSSITLSKLGLEFDLFAADLRIATKLDEFIPR